MKYLLLLTVLLLSAFTFAQYKDGDTIYLKELKVDKSYKKPKLKTVKMGDKESRVTNYSTFFKSSDQIYYHKVDNTVYGTIEELVLHFSMISKQIELGNVRGNRTIKSTEYELNFFRVTDEGNVGNRVNTQPLKLTVSQSKEWHRKIKIDISKLNFETDAFFITFKNLTDISCDECYYYSPASSKSKKPEIFHDEEILADNGKMIKKRRRVWPEAAFIEIKTLTRDY